MTPPYPVRYVSIFIDRPPTEVYAFVVNPENLPRWAKGLGSSIEQLDGEWVADSPMGKVKVRFVESNPFGVLDHHVVLPSGEAVYNPLRVVPNGGGSELVFTLFRRPEMSEESFAADAETVAADLAALKRLLEGL